MSEVKGILDMWDAEFEGTIKLLESLPVEKYDFRPDEGGRSLGELAWHLAESDGYISFGIEQGTFQTESKPAHLERPRTVKELAPGYRQVHEDACTRVRKLKDKDLDRPIKFFDGSPRTVREVLWNYLVMHLIHHRGQLTLMCRLAGGMPPGLFGHSREEAAAAKQAMEAAAQSA